MPLDQRRVLLQRLVRARNFATTLTCEIVHSLIVGNLYCHSPSISLLGWLFEKARILILSTVAYGFICHAVRRQRLGPDLEVGELHEHTLVMPGLISPWSYEINWYLSGKLA